MYLFLGTVKEIQLPQPDQNKVFVFGVGLIVNILNFLKVLPSLKWSKQPPPGTILFQRLRSN